ncbi:MAG TPA: NTP transferase domain-containing protein [Dermatophilaceae bacterium]|nr:NTP transferase domain-containing protein [Dermatophilaceae bacterium]
MTATVVVLAGGTSVRFGADKLAAPLWGTTVLDRTLAGMPAGWPVVCVGPGRTTVRDVLWTREEPPGGGPLAGIAAGARLAASAVTVVVAGDMPGAGAAVPALVAALVAAPDDVAAVVGTDASGHANPLLAAYRTLALRRALPAEPRDRAARTLLRALPHRALAVDGPAAADVDTREALEDVRRRLGP